MVLSIFWTTRAWNILQTLPLTNQLYDTGLSWSMELQIAWEEIQENYHMQYRTQNLFYSGQNTSTLFVFYTVLNNSNGVMWDLDSSLLSCLSTKSDQHKFSSNNIRISEYHEN